MTDTYTEKYKCKSYYDDNKILNCSCGECEKYLKMNTTKQAAEKLGINEATVRQYLRSGYLKGTKFGKAWVISDKEIERRLQHIKDRFCECGNYAMDESDFCGECV